MKWRIALLLFVIVMTILAAIATAELGDDYLGAYIDGYLNSYALFGAWNLISRHRG